MKILDDTPVELTEGIGRLFIIGGPNALPRVHPPSSDPSTSILVMEDVETILTPDLLALLARHRAQGDPPVSSMFRGGIAGRVFVVVMYTSRVPDLRESIFLVPTIRLMSTPPTGPGLLRLVCLEEEWTPATGITERPIDRPWPREN
jgi:hypothetical protein